jgi:hypothetical protein
VFIVFLPLISFNFFREAGPAAHILGPDAGGGGARTRRDVVGLRVRGRGVSAVCIHVHMDVAKVVTERMA